MEGPPAEEARGEMPDAGQWKSGRGMYFVFDEQIETDTALTAYGLPGVIAFEEYVPSAKEAAEYKLSCALRWGLDVTTAHTISERVWLSFFWITQEELHGAGTGVLCMCMTPKHAARSRPDTGLMTMMHSVQFGSSAAVFPVYIQKRAGDGEETMFQGYGFACDRTLYPVVPFVAASFLRKIPTTGRDTAALKAARDRIWLEYALGMWATLSNRTMLLDPKEGYCAFYAVEKGSEPCILDWRSIVMYGTARLDYGGMSADGAWAVAIDRALYQKVFRKVRDPEPEVGQSMNFEGRPSFGELARQRLRNIAAELLKYEW